MAWKTRKVAVCDVCKYEWLPKRAELPKHCASPECRSTLWNSGGRDRRKKENRGLEK
jgi:hypothetical protein